MNRSFLGFLVLFFAQYIFAIQVTIDPGGYAGFHAVQGQAGFAKGVRVVDVSANDVDAIAIANYLGVYASLPENETAVVSLTADQLMTDLLDGSQGFEDNPDGQVNAISSFVTTHQTAANAVDDSVRIVAYEGGMHLSGLGAAEDNDALQSLYEAVSRDPRMETLFDDFFSAWRNSGADLMMHFLPVQRWIRGHGTFGSLQYETDTASNYPRECSIRKFVSQQSCWWSGCERN